VLRNGELVTTLDASEVETLLADGTAHGGMVPKLRAALAAATAGCAVAIVDGTDPAAVRAALDGTATGTTVTETSRAGIG
jgi:acetylglutamate kinase